MFVSLFYILLSIIGLSFLIFIHELGHYWMARRVGMHVEIFSIGFGKPIYSWERNGVKWQLGWLFFGGYVKIAGTDLSGSQDPYTVPGGFFSKTPWQRLKVAVMGPLANLLLAFIFFAFLWLSGGREKNFSEYTSIIGWVDPQSELYADGIRPGDEIVSYNGVPYQSAKDHLYMPMTAGQSKISIAGNRLDYAHGTKIPFERMVKLYQHPASIEKGRVTAGITQPANYIIYDKLPNGQDNPLTEDSPLYNSGLEYGDRFLWLDGELVFSLQQLQHILNGSTALLTIERGPDTYLRRVPRILMHELKPDAAFREELIDWQHEAKLNTIKPQNLFTIPYNITNDGVVENELKFIDKEKQEEAFPHHLYSSLEAPLEPGDRIIAIDGQPIKHASELLRELQNYHVNIVVERNPQSIQSIPAGLADHDFEKRLNWGDLKRITASLGTDHPVTHSGNYYLLKRVAPRPLNKLHLSPEIQSQIATELSAKKKEIESNSDPEKKAQQLRILAEEEKRLYLGLPRIQDRRVNYNPLPTTLFSNVFSEVWRTLEALVSGSLSPKWISGPIGIVQVVYDTSLGSIKEALFWLGAISLNLGLLNLLPIPVLDGGTILMSLIEIVTRRRIHPSTLEKVVIPFGILLIAFFVFLTYNDLLRLFRHLW